MMDDFAWPWKLHLHHADAAACLAHYACGWNRHSSASSTGEQNVGTGRLREEVRYGRLVAFPHRLKMLAEIQNIISKSVDDAALWAVVCIDGRSVDVCDVLGASGNIAGFMVVLGQVCRECAIHDDTKWIVAK